MLTLAVPLAGLALVVRGRARFGEAAVLADGLASAGFGTFYHFVAETPDHVGAHIGAWSVPFLVTAVGVSLLAVVGA